MSPTAAVTQCSVVQARIGAKLRNGQVARSEQQLALRAAEWDNDYLAIRDTRSMSRRFRKWVTKVCTLAIRPSCVCDVRATLPTSTVEPRISGF